MSPSPSGNFVLTENRWVALKVKNKKDLRSRSTLCMCKRFFCVFYVDLCATDFDPPRITNSIIFFLTNSSPKFARLGGFTHDTDLQHRLNSTLKCDFAG